MLLRAGCGLGNDIDQIVVSETKLSTRTRTEKGSLDSQPHGCPVSRLVVKNFDLTM